MTEDLSDYHIPGTDKVFYIPNFISSEEEIYLIRKILESPRQKWKNLANRRLQMLGGELTSKNCLLVQDMPSWIDKFPDISGRLRKTGAFKSSPHGGPNHIILNEYLPGQGIMPHEDGPAYHPVVATISLGSHAVFHYYQYKTDESSMDPDGPLVIPETSEGRPIDPIPVVSLLLERRSVVITMSAMYHSHLHGIQDIKEDAFDPAQEGISSSLVRALGVAIANEGMISGERERACIEEGGVLIRGTRYSLTCRDIERVVRAGPRGRGS